MKILIVLLFVILNTSAFARQYIQCAHENSWDRMVINLDGDQSTLFMTSGVHLPDAVNVLKVLNFIDADQNNHYYETTGDVYEEIIISNDFINKALSNFEVIIKIIDTKSNYQREAKVSCFSSIYN